MKDDESGDDDTDELISELSFTMIISVRLFNFFCK